MGIGAYRHRVTLEHPAAVLDPVDWYCAIQSAASQVADGQAAFFVRGRYHPGITLETQINFEGRTLQVQGITDLDERHVELQLVCVEVVGRGRELDRPPYITTQPESTLILSGTSATLTVLAGGTLPLSYQWMKNGVFLPGATGASYATGPLSATASYSVRVSNAEGFVTSTAATVTVVVPATIITHPQSTTTGGSSVTLTVVATGTPPLVYQWTKNGVEIAGATSASYVTGPLAATTVYAVTVANAYGTVTSNPATVTYSNPLLASLVSYWSFETGWNDVHGTNHLTNVNGVTRVAGKLGQAGDFETSSSQYLSHPDSNPLGDENFTYALWFKQETQGALRQLLSKDAVGARSYFLQFQSEQALSMSFGAATVVANDSTPVNNLNWHFVVTWHDAATNTLNIQTDNGPVGTVATGGVFPAANPTVNVRIGAREYTSFEGYFDGLIDDVALWRRVLTPAERAQLWNAGNGLAYPFA